MIKSVAAELKNKCGAETLVAPDASAVYLRVDQKYMPEIAASLQSQGFILGCAFGTGDFQHKGLSVIYIFEQRGDSLFLSLVTELAGNEAVSIAQYFPNACYSEREIADGFGIAFSGAFDTRRLFLHDVYPDDFHPLLKSFKNGPLDVDYSNSSQKSYKFRPCTGEGVYQVPVGPVHAGIIEPGHFRFGVIGETIFNLEIRHFYKHRGLEKLAEGKSPPECVRIAEAVSGDESAANALACSMAVERISDIAVPAKAWQIRTILLELERAYSHLGDLAGMVLDVAFPTGAAPFFNLREEVLRQNGNLAGSRFSKGIIVPGGLARDIPQAKLTALGFYTNDFVGRLEEAVEGIENSSWVVDRFETAGIIKPELIAPLNLTGPVARASGTRCDTRIDHPYGIYSGLRVELYPQTEGDVMTRFQVKANEVKNSIRMIQDILDRVAGGPVYVECPATDGFALSAVESARGQNLHWLNIKNGVVERYKVRTASFCNWPAIEHAVLGNIVADFPVINKSMNLSYAGNDL
jgi:formate hydrogenlyase subunit 5